MSSPPILIDGLAHVSRTGLWIDGKRDASRETLLQQMDSHGISGAILTALPGRISDQDVIAACAASPGRFFGFSCPPISGQEKLKESIQDAKAKGLVGIKFHSRLGNFSLREPRVEEAVRHAVDLDMPVLVCSVTEARGKASQPPAHDSIGRWADLYPQATFILAHAGGHRILDAWHTARVRENLYLDLSHTLHYYRGASVEKDIGFVARRLDQRVLFGSDFPECNLGEALAAVGKLLEPWPEANRNGILGENWVSLLKKHGAWRPAHPKT